MPANSVARWLAVQSSLRRPAAAAGTASRAVKPSHGALRCATLCPSPAAHCPHCPLPAFLFCRRGVRELRQVGGAAGAAGAGAAPPGRRQLSTAARAADPSGRRTLEGAEQLQACRGVIALLAGPSSPAAQQPLWMLADAHACAFGHWEAHQACLSPWLLDPRPPSLCLPFHACLPACLPACSTAPPTRVWSKSICHTPQLAA